MRTLKDYYLNIKQKNFEQRFDNQKEQSFRYGGSVIHKAQPEIFTRALDQYLFVLHAMKYFF